MAHALQVLQPTCRTPSSKTSAAVPGRLPRPAAFSLRKNLLQRTKLFAK